MRKIVFVDDDLEFYFRIIRISQNLSHPTLRTCPLRRVTCDLSHHDLIGARPLRLPFRDIDLLENSLVLRDEVGIILRSHKLTHDLPKSPLENPDDLPLFPLL